jgi:CheY-like chemotaxis protein
MTSPGRNGGLPRGTRVLIVEDEAMIRMLLEDMLEELGCTIVATAGGIEEALAAARDQNFDVALLDVNLQGINTGPVAKVLAARSVPFVFATGYGEQGLPEGYRDRPALKKPFQTDGLARMLQSALAGKS